MWKIKTTPLASKRFEIPLTALVVILVLNKRTLAFASVGRGESDEHRGLIDFAVKIVLVGEGKRVRKPHITITRMMTIMMETRRDEES